LAVLSTLAVTSESGGENRKGVIIWLKQDVTATFGSFSGRQRLSVQMFTGVFRQYVLIVDVALLTLALPMPVAMKFKIMQVHISRNLRW
jgi:hypothetical protein